MKNYVLKTNSIKLAKDLNTRHWKVMALIEDTIDVIKGEGEDMSKFFIEEFDERNNIVSYKITPYGAYLLPKKYHNKEMSMVVESMLVHWCDVIEEAEKNGIIKQDEKLWN